MQKLQSNKSRIYGGALFSVLALIQIFFTSLSSNRPTILISLLLMVSYAVLAYCSFSNKRGNILVAGISLVGLIQLVIFLKGFSNKSYVREVYIYKRGITYKFNLILMLPNLLTLIGYIFAVAITISLLTKYLNKNTEKLRKLFYIPAACILGAIALAFIALLMCFINLIPGTWVGSQSYFHFMNFVKRVLEGLSIYFALAWIAYPDGVPKKSKATNKSNSGTVNNQTASPSSEWPFCSLAKHVLLLLFTCGIWNLIWIYKTTDYLNCVENEKYRDPTKNLLLCMFIPFYMIFWGYQSAQRIDKLAKTKGAESDISTMCLILYIFVAIVPPIIMQDKINKIVTNNSEQVNYTQNQTSQSNNVAQSPVNQNVVQSNDTINQLKNYKELLDSGVITQDEFDSKKKQLLDI